MIKVYVRWEAEGYGEYRMDKCHADAKGINIIQVPTTVWREYQEHLVTCSQWQRRLAALKSA